MPVVLRGRGPSNGLLFFLLTHRMWVGALLAAVLLSWLPAGLLSGFGHAGANTDAETATVAYRMIATAVERWTLSPVLLLRSGWSVSADCAGRRDAAVVEVATHGGDGEALHGTAARRIGLQAVRFSTETSGPMVLGLRRILRGPPISDWQV